MRIALVTDAWFPQVNGVVRTLSHVVKELEAMGHHVDVIGPHLFPTFPCPRYPEIRLSWMPGRKTRDLLDEWQPDAIHIATEGTLGMTARRYCRRRKLPFTTSYHTQFPHYLKKYTGIPRRLTYAGMRWFHNAANGTLVPTPAVKRELDERGFTNIIVWTRGVDHELFRPYDDRGGLDLDLPRPIFLYAGRTAREKNIEAFLSAQLPGSKLVVGGGPELDGLRKRYPDAHFVGYKYGEELARHYAASDVFVFPSRTDTFGVVMLEAMATGVPVAAYPVTGPIDVVEQGVSGILDDDITIAATKALELDRERVREYARGFTWRRCAEVFLDTLSPITRPSKTTAQPVSAKLNDRDPAAVAARK